MQALSEYGWRLGLAFQITDDLLDVEGAQELVGKGVGKDAAQHKYTFPGMLGVPESRARVQTLIREAQAENAVFGERGTPLALLAEYVGERKS